MLISLVRGDLLWGLMDGSGKRRLRQPPWGCRKQCVWKGVCFALCDRCLCNVGVIRVAEGR